MATRTGEKTGTLNTFSVGDRNRSLSKVVKGRERDGIGGIWEKDMWMGEWMKGSERERSGSEGMER